MALTLAVVEAAIEKLIAGSQSVTVDGMSYTKASLSALIDIRKQLKRESGHRFGFSMRPMKAPEH